VIDLNQGKCALYGELAWASFKALARRFRALTLALKPKTFLGADA